MRFGRIDINRITIECVRCQSIQCTFYENQHQFPIHIKHCKLNGIHNVARSIRVASIVSGVVVVLCSYCCFWLKSVRCTADTLKSATHNLHSLTLSTSLYLFLFYAQFRIHKFARIRRVAIVSILEGKQTLYSLSNRWYILLFIQKATM